MIIKVLYVGFSMIGDPDATGQTLNSFFSKAKNLSILQACLDYDNSRHSDAFDVCYISKYKSPIYYILKRLYRSDHLKATTSSEVFQDTNRIKGNPLVAFARAFLDILPKRFSRRDNKRIEAFNPDVIYTLGENIATLRKAIRYSKKYDAPIVIHVMDNIDDCVYSYWNLTKPFRAWYHTLLRELYNRSTDNLAISPKMAEEYARRHSCRFGFAMNSVDSLHPLPKPSNNDKIHMVFSGGLHGGRAETLRRVGQTIQQYEPLREMLDFTIYTSTIFCNNYQSLSEEGIIIKEYVPRDYYYDNLAMYDILVHVESFDEENIKYFTYSMSTKIPEYLSVGRPLFVVGPKEICTVEYLESTGAAFVAESDTDIKDVLFNIINGKNSYDEKARYSIKCAERDFLSDNTAQRVENVINAAINNWNTRK